MKSKIEEQTQKEKILVAQKETNVFMDKPKYSLQTQAIVFIEAPSWKGIEGRTGGPGWGALGAGKDQEIVVSLNKNSTPVLQIIDKDSKWIPKLHFELEN